MRGTDIISIPLCQDCGRPVDVIVEYRAYKRRVVYACAVCRASDLGAIWPEKGQGAAYSLQGPEGRDSGKQKTLHPTPSTLKSEAA